MLYRVETIIPPTAPAVDLNYVKQFARVTNTVDDAIISSFIYLATELAEKYLNLSIGTKTLQMTIAHTPIPQTYSASVWSSYNWPANYPEYQRGMKQEAIHLLYGPVQAVNSVSFGFWGQSPDSFLTLNQDYVIDLASLPGRVRLCTLYGQPWFPDHISIQYVAGYGWTNLIQVLGTATAADTLTMTVAGQTISVAVNVGDTAQTVTGNALAALQAAPNVPSALMLSPSMLQLRGDNVTATVTHTPNGLTVTTGVPATAVPERIRQAITWLVAHVYQNIGEDIGQPPEWFYQMLDHDRIKCFA